MQTTFHPSNIPLTISILRKPLHPTLPNTHANMHLILTGATGTVGTAVLHNLLHSPTISKISILSRRPVLQAEGHEKVNVIIHKDFSKYDEVTMRKLEDADGVIWALGVSQNSVGKE